MARLLRTSVLALVLAAAGCDEAATGQGACPGAACRDAAGGADTDGRDGSRDGSGDSGASNAAPDGGAAQDGGDAASQVGCRSASECPTPAGLSACEVAACLDGACAVQNIKPGTALADQTAGDCRERVCDADGAEALVDDDSDVPEDDGNACTSDACDTGSAQHLPEPAGTACAQDDGMVCDGHGACVECAQSSDCASDVCQDGECRPALCGNGTLDSGESDVDCGGDCGGCGPGEMCVENADCVGTECTLSACVANCDDGVQNNAESDVDCGASCVGKPCANGFDCGADTDCDSAFCHPTSDQCATPSCSDGFKNGTETAVDCGGTSNGVVCPACVTPCTDNWECDGVSGIGKGLCYDGHCVDDVNGCTIANAMDLTSMVTASLTTPIAINFGGSFGTNYSPRCIKVTMGTKIQFVGSTATAFVTHPLLGGIVVASTKQPASTGPFTPITNTGISKDFLMDDDCASYPYYCNVHGGFGMNGAVIVLPPP